MGLFPGGVDLITDAVALQCGMSAKQGGFSCQCASAGIYGRLREFESGRRSAASASLRVSSTAGLVRGTDHERRRRQLSAATGPSLQLRTVRPADRGGRRVAVFQSRQGHGPQTPPMFRLLPGHRSGILRSQNHRARLNRRSPRTGGRAFGRQCTAMDGDKAGMFPAWAHLRRKSPRGTAAAPARWRSDDAPGWSPC